MPAPRVDACQRTAMHRARRVAIDALAIATLALRRGRHVALAALAIAALPLITSCERSTEALLRRFAAADSGAALRFPRVRTGLRTAPLAIADPGAPACDPLPPDTAQWRANILPTDPDDASWITIRTPFRMPPSFPGAPRTPQARVDTAGLHRLLGSWSVERAGSPLPGSEEQAFAIWLGVASYPTEVLPLGTHQIALSECVSAAAGYALHLAHYSLVWSGGDTTHHLAAYLPLHGDTAVTVLGRALTTELRAELAAAVRTLRVFRRTPS